MEIAQDLYFREVLLDTSVEGGQLKKQKAKGAGKYEEIYTTPNSEGRIIFQMRIVEIGMYLRHSRDKIERKTFSWVCGIR